MDVYWADTQKTILVRELPRVWTWHDYKASIHKMMRMLEEVRHDVVLIIDCRNIPWLPKGSIAHFDGGDRNLPSNVILRVMVSESQELDATSSNLPHSQLWNFTEPQRIASLPEDR